MSEKFKLSDEEQEAIARAQAAGNLPESLFAAPALLACPFCGWHKPEDADEPWQEKTVFFVRCGMCKARTNGAFNRGQGRLQWNTRRQANK